MKKIIVTGATGFIGQRLCNRLIRDNHGLIPLSSKNGDISNPHLFSKYEGQSIDHVFHLAAKTFVPRSWEEPSVFFKTNVTGTANVLDFCNRNKCSLTFVSAYVYGANAINPISEDLIPKPNNPYALSKAISEELCSFYAKYYNVAVNIVRPFNIYGPGQSEDFLIPYLIKQIKSNTDTITVKDLYPKRDYIHVDDLTDCLIAAMNYKHYDIFNAGYGKSYSVNDVIEFLFELSQKKIPVISENVIRKNEISDTIANISKSKKILNWEPKIDLKSGLLSMLKSSK